MTRCARILYSQAEMNWLSDNREMIISDYHRAFCDAFRRTDVTAAHLHGLRKRVGWKVGRAPGRFAGRHLLFSKGEIAWLRENCTETISDYHAGFCATFSRADISARQLFRLRKSEGWKTGRTGHFKKGGAPANKGKKMPFNANAARTQFKPGQLPQNTKFDGHERVDKQTGFTLIRVSETNPWTGAATRYLPKQLVLWRAQHGPLPEGMVLKCKGDPANPDPSNWEAIPRGMLPRLNGKRRSYDAAPDSLKPTIMAVAKLEHRLRNTDRQ
jgi:hypothetical protein